MNLLGFLTRPKEDVFPQTATRDAEKKNADAPVGGRQGNQPMSNVAPMPSAGKPARLQSEVKLVTPQLARQLRTDAHFERQRNISPPNVSRLATEMRSGRFTPGTQIFICVLPDGTERVVNGNHTLEAVCESGAPQLLTMTRLHVRDLDECGQVYAVFDIQKLRSWRDSLRAVGTGDDLPNAANFLSAVLSIKQGFAQRIVSGSVSRPEVLSTFEEYKEAAGHFNVLCEGAPTSTTKLIRRAAILGVALETLRYQPTAAFEFWHRCAQDDGLTSGMPERALLIWLRNNTAGSSSNRVAHGRAAALAWNAFFRGEERGFIKPGAMASFFLLGTPWANGLGD